MSTNVFSSKDIKREWHFIDAKDQILGRLATQIATILMGKNKVTFVPYLDNGDYVVVTNAKLIKVTGKKLDNKRYVRHSGYPGGLKVEILGKMLPLKSGKVIEHAVWGMLPHTKLGKSMLKKLKVFSEDKHPFKVKAQE